MGVGDITFPRETGRILEGMLATVVVVEVLGGTLLMAEATLDGDDRMNSTLTKCTGV